MLARRSTVKPGLSHRQFLFRREPGSSRRQSTHARPLPQTHIASKVSIFGNVFKKGGDWLLIVMEEILITFAVMP